MSVSRWNAGWRRAARATEATRARREGFDASERELREGLLADLRTAVQRRFPGRAGRSGRLRRNVVVPSAVVAGRTSIDDLGTHAGALTYASLIAIPPLLLFSMSIASFVLADNQAALREAISDLAGLFPGELGSAIETFLTQQLNATLSGRLSVGILGLIGLLWTASSLASRLRHAFGQIFGTRRSGLLTGRVVGAVTGLLMVLAIFGLALLSMVTTWAAGVSDRAALVTAASSLGLVAGEFLFFLVLFLVLTPGSARNPAPGMRDHVPGAIAFVLSWTALQFLGGYYFSRVVAGSTALYGTVGALFGVIAFLYATTWLLLLAAEISAEFRSRSTGAAAGVAVAPPAASNPDEPRTMSAMPADLIDRYAELVVRVGANVQKGQDVHLWAAVEHVGIARAVAEHAYRAGARKVVVRYDDQSVRRSAIEHAPLDALSAFYPHDLDEIRSIGAHHGAMISLTGNPDPHAFDGLDPDRVAAAARPPELGRAVGDLVMGGDVNWVIAAAPNEGWANQIFGSPDVDRLWDAVAVATRLDQPDPVEAWREHVAVLTQRQAALQRLAPDAIRFRGPDTDLTIGLLPGAGWLSGVQHTNDGVEFIPNIPTEEVFTSPDRRRAEGMVRITAPLVMPRSRVLVEGLRLRLSEGRITQADADTGAEAVRAELALDDGAPYLGEVAIVDGSSRVRAAGVAFHDTLYDENAGCHIAYGRGFPMVLDDRVGLGPEALVSAGVNHSSVHTDVVVGGPDVEVDAVAADGTVTPLVRDDAWVLPLG